MASLRDYKIKDKELQAYGLVLSDYLIDNSSAAVIERGYQALITRIFNVNHDIYSQNDIYDWLKTDEMVDDFKYAQFLVIWGLINLDDNPITAEVDAIINDRLKLKKLNGFQR